MNREIFVECHPLLADHTAFHDTHVDSGNAPTSKEHGGSVLVGTSIKYVCVNLETVGEGLVEAILEGTLSFEPVDGCDFVMWYVLQDKGSACNIKDL